MAILFSAGRFKATDKTNAPIPGAFLSFYATLTSTFQPIYADSALSSDLTNPVKADANGLFPEVWLDDSLAPYKVVFASPNVNDPSVPGSVIWTIAQYNNVVAAAALAQTLAPLLNPATEDELNSGVTIVNYAYDPFYVERYGADPTGVADSGPGFRAACQVALAAGGGRIFALGALYNFTTWDTSSFQGSNNVALFCLPANTELVGGGIFSTKLRLSATARTGMYGGGSNRVHIIGMRTGQTGQFVHDLAFDYNGIVQTASTEFCYFARTMSGGAKYERCSGVQAPLTNAIVDSSFTTTQPAGLIVQKVIVRDCWFQDNGPAMTGNTLNTDYSCLYLEAPDSLVEGSRIFNTAIATSNCGGIEMHTPLYTARDNYIVNMFPAMYLGVQNTPTTVSAGSLVEGNYIVGNNTGLVIIDRHNGLKITKNFFAANQDSDIGTFGSTFGDIYTPLDSVTGIASAGLQQGLSIIDNTFDCGTYRQGTPRSGNPSTAINLSALNGADISHNTFLQATPGLIIINGTITAPTQDTSITDNTLIDATDATGGFFNVLGTSAAGWGAGCTLQDIFIRRNHLLRNRTLSAGTAYSLIATGGGSFNPTFTNVRFEDNDVVNVSPAIDVVGTGAAVIVNGQSAATQSITANGQTINTAGVTTQRVTAASAFTGIILQAGTVANQRCTVMHEGPGADTLTMAGSGSNVADATSCVISGATQKTFYWDANTLLWYRS